jgi:hypothetical protein
MEQRVDLPSKVFAVFIANELRSFQSEQSILFAVAAAIVVACFGSFCGIGGVATSEDPIRSSPRMFLVARQEVGCKDNGLNLMALFLGFIALHGEYIDFVRVGS